MVSSQWYKSIQTLGRTQMRDRLEEAALLGRTIKRLERYKARAQDDETAAVWADLEMAMTRRLLMNAAQAFVNGRSRKTVRA